MSTRKFSTALAFSGLALISSNASAITKQCDRCSATDMEQVAYESLTQMRWEGPLYVVDGRGGVVRKYEYRSNQGPDWNPEFDLLEQWPQEVATEQLVITGVAKAAASLFEGRVPEQVIVNPGANDMPEDSYQALTNDGYDLKVDRYIKTMIGSEQYMNRFAQFLNEINGVGAFNPNAITVRVELIYQDGSRAMYTFNLSTGQYERSELSTRDSAGHLIPETKDAMLGKTYDFENAALGDARALDDLADLADRARDFGFTVRDVTKYEPGTKYSMTCSGDICTITAHY